MSKEKSFEYKLVVVARSDLKLSPGKLSVQVAHASVSCALSAKKNKREWFKKWYDEGQKKVVVKVDTVEELYELKEIAEGKKLPTCLVRDAGLTEIPSGTVTCLGIGPGPNPIVDSVTGELTLYR